LAAQAGLSAGQLSQVENGTGNPSVETLIRIAGALDLYVTDLLEPQATTHTYVVRREKRRQHQSLGMEYTTHLMTPGLHHQLTATYNIMLPGEAHATEMHEGDIFTYVLKGELEVMKGSATYRLRAHDSLIIRLPNVVACKGDAPVEFIGIFRPDGG